MPLSFSQLCSWALPLLLVSNLLLWENVASYFSSKEIDGDEVYLKKLFDNAMILSKSISKLNMELRRKYMFEFLGGQKLLVKNLAHCHNYSIKTPANMDDGQKISTSKMMKQEFTEDLDGRILYGKPNEFNKLEDFPKLILSRVKAWNPTLDNLLTILGSMPGVHDDVLSIAKDIRTKNAELFKNTKSILNKVYGTTENVDYTRWSGLEDLQSSDEDIRFFAFRKLSYCLHVDIQAVDFSLKLLSCVVLAHSDICLLSQTGDDP